MESKAYSLVKKIKETSTLFNADHIYCNPSQLLENENNKKENVNNLKSMLILHLEVVKEQAEQLLSKDKLIAKLRQENEELKERLEKYEQRRDNHQQQAKRMSSLTKTSPATDSLVMVAATNNNLNNKKTKGRSQVSSVINHLEHNHESKIINLCRDNATTIERYTNNCVTPTKRPNEGDSGKTLNKRRKVDKQTQNEQTPLKTKIDSSFSVDPYEFTVDEPSVNVSLSQESDGVISNSQQISEEVKRVPRNAFITTSTDYILCDWQKSDAELDAAMEPLLRASLEIPSWSIKERPQSSYSLEVTENLSDDTFTKRHSKFEIDERRRKKWDVQRLREQKQVERLKKRYLKDEYEEKEPNLEYKSITSFYPSPENIKYIQIVEDIPVLAFGEPIPSIPEGDFKLSWLSNTDKSNLSPTTCFTKTRFFCKKK